MASPLLSNSVPAITMALGWSSQKTYHALRSSRSEKCNIVLPGSSDERLQELSFHIPNTLISPDARSRPVMPVLGDRRVFRAFHLSMLIQHMPLLLSKRIVLASASPRRSELFRGLGLKVEVVPSTFEETLDKSLFAAPGDYAAETATHKAIEVSRRLMQINTGKNADLIVSADTIVELDGMILEKPRDERDAFRMLSSLSGRQHKVYTGVVLLLPSASDPIVGQPPLMRTFWEETKVEFGNLDEATISAYIATGEPMDKAGSYGIQGIGASLVKSVNGCFYNVVGFPLHRFSVELDGLVRSGFLGKLEPATSSQ